VPRAIRTEKATLKRKKGRRAGSTRWLERHINDPYVQEARREGYRARSVFKLKEIDERFRLVRPGGCVVDLGAAPGSWSQYCAAKGASVVALDLQAMEAIPGVVILEGDFTEGAVQDAVAARLGGAADLVLSDIAPNATGKRVVDRLRAESLGEAALDFAARVLGAEGRALVKLIKGAEAAVMAGGRRHFRTLKLIRPEATRRDSSEIYLLASGRLTPAEGAAAAAGTA